MAKTLIWPFRNGQAISKPLKSFKMAMAVSKRPKVSKRQVTNILIFKIKDGQNDTNDNLVMGNICKTKKCGI